jgi:hypothetical protein
MHTYESVVCSFFVVSCQPVVLSALHALYSRHPHPSFHLWPTQYGFAACAGFPMLNTFGPCPFARLLLCVWLVLPHCGSCNVDADPSGCCRYLFVLSLCLLMQRWLCVGWLMSRAGHCWWALPSCNCLRLLPMLLVQRWSSACLPDQLCVWL